MLKVEATNEVKTKTVNSSTFRNQVVFVSMPGKKYPAEIFISLRREQQPYPAGVYTISDESFRLAVEYGEPRLEFFPVLIPVPAAAKVA